MWFNRHREATFKSIKVSSEEKGCTLLKVLLIFFRPEPPRNDSEKLVHFEKSVQILSQVIKFFVYHS